MCIYVYLLLIYNFKLFRLIGLIIYLNYEFWLDKVFLNFAIFHFFAFSQFINLCDSSVPKLYRMEILSKTYYLISTE